MNPRIRIVAVVLAVAFLAVPAQASASAFSLPSCVPSTPFGADPLLDTIDVDPAWRTSDMTISSDSLPAGVAWEWSTDCGATVNPAVSGDDVTVTGEGIHRFSHRVQDSGGWTQWVDHLVRIDLSNPVNTSSTPTDWSRGPLAVNVTGTDLSGIALAEWRDGLAGAFTTGAVATVGATTGIHQLHTRVTDAVGHTHERTHAVQIDNTVPVDDTDPPDVWQRQITVVSIEGTDVDSGVGHVEWELDGVRGNGDTGDTVSIGHGIHQLKTRIVDAVGNATPWVTHDPIKVDIAGPVDTTTVPSGWVTDGNEVQVSISGTDSSGVGVNRTEWKLTNTFTNAVQSGDVAGPGPVPVTVSGDGVHKLETRLTDGVGDTSGWRTQYVRIDHVIPFDTTNPAGGWHSQALNVTVGGTDEHSDVERVEWKLNGTSGSFIGSSHVVPVATDGVNTLKTRIIDNAGNASQWKTHTIYIDLTLPLNLTAAAPTAWLKDPYVVTLQGSDSGSRIDVIRWRLGTGPVYQEPSGTPITIDTTGVHTLYTWAVDKVGNVSAERAETVKIDLVKPVDATVYPGGSIPRGRRITFAPTDADSGVAGMEWTVNGAPRTGTSVAFGKVGTYTLATRVRDNAGNVSDWATRTITVDATAPEDTTAPVDTTAAPTGWERGPYTLAVTAEDAGTEVEKVEWRGDRNGSGSAGSTLEFATEGVHHIETRAIDAIGNTSAWRAHVVKVDLTNPQDTTAFPTGWTNSRTVTLSAGDATSGVAAIQYTVNGGAVSTPVLTIDPDDADKATASFTLPADGKFKVAHRVLDGSENTSVWKTDNVWVDTVLPTNTRSTAPATWQTSALTLALAGTDAHSGFDHAEWRVDGGDVQAGTTARVETQGTQLLETRVVDKAGNVSAWDPQTVKVDTTKPVNTTAAVTTTWHKTNFTTTVTGTDATPGSGVLRVEYRVDNGSITTTPAVSITATGSHKLETRVVDTAGNDSGWRVETVGIDKTNPTLSVDCGGDAWRAAPAVCSVNAAGGESGLSTVTATRGGASDTVSGNSYTVDADGSLTVLFRAVDGAGNETLASTAVKIDRTAPTASVSCTPGAGTTYVCKGDGADNLSGVTGMRWSVDGSAATPMSSGGTFVVAKGKVIVTAVDAAGNVGASAPVALADRTPPVVTPPDDETVTPRTTSDAVLLRRSGPAFARLLGQLAIAATPSRTTVDLRPLALGSGTFQFTFKVTTDKKSKTYLKTVKTKKGYSARIQIKAAAAAHAKVVLTIKRKSGRRWVSHAAGTAELE